MTSPWKDYPPTSDDMQDVGHWLYDNKGNPKGHADWRPWNAPSERVSPAPQRWLAVLIVLAVVCAVVMVFGGLPTLPAIRP